MSTNVPISKRLVLINSASSVVTRLLNVTVLVWVLQYLLKRIDADEYALLPVFMAIMVFVPLLSTFLTAGLARYVTEAYANGDQERITQITSTMFVLLLAAGLALGVAGLTLAYYVDFFLTISPDRLTDARWMMGLLMASAAIRLPLSPFGVGLFVRQKFVTHNLIEVACTLLRVVLLLVLLLGIGPQIKWVVVARVVSNLTSVGLITFLSRRAVQALRFRRECVEWSVAREITSFGAWFTLSHIAFAIRHAADPIILNKLATAVDVTAFHIGSLVDRQIREMTITASQPIQPVLTAMHAKGEKQRLAGAYLRGGRLTLWAAMFIAVPLMVYRYELLSLYLADEFETYSSAALVMLLLLTAILFIYPSNMVNKISVATARVRTYTMCTFIAQLTNLCITLLLVGPFQMGAIGSALATFGTTLLFQPLMFWPLGLRMLDIKLRRFIKDTIVPGYAPTIVALVIGELLRQVIHPVAWVPLCGCILASLASYAIVMGLCLTAVDRRDIGVMFENIAGRLLSSRKE